MRILVAGATGLTGRRVVQDLLSAGHEPVALVRAGADTSVLPDDCQKIVGDLTDLPFDIAKGVDAIIFAAGSGSHTGIEATRAVDRDGAVGLIDRARMTALKRFVMLSSKGAEAPASGPDALEPYLQAKRFADDYLKTSGLDYTIVRPVALTREAGTGRVELAASVDSAGELAREDLARLLVACVTEPALLNQTVEVRAGDTPIAEAAAGFGRSAAYPASGKLAAYADA